MNRYVYLLIIDFPFIISVIVWPSKNILLNVQIINLNPQFDFFLNFKYKKSTKEKHEYMNSS